MFLIPSKAMSMKLVYESNTNLNCLSYMPLITFDDSSNHLVPLCIVFSMLSLICVAGPSNAVLGNCLVMVSNIALPAFKEASNCLVLFSTNALAISADFSVTEFRFAFKVSVSFKVFIIYLLIILIWLY